MGLTFRIQIILEIEIQESPFKGEFFSCGHVLGDTEEREKRIGPVSDKEYNIQCQLGRMLPNVISNNFIESLEKYF